MTKVLILSIAMFAQIALADGIRYYNQVEIPTSSVQVKLDDAQYAEIPTQTVVHPIPGCNPNSEAGTDCNKTVVIKREPAIVANISYRDSTNHSDEGQQMTYTSVLFKTSDFSAADVAALQAVYPQWKHPFSSVPRNFAKNKLSLNLAKVMRTIKIVDVRHSHLCSIGESGMPDPGCVERIVYKDATTIVLTATVTVK